MSSLSLHQGLAAYLAAHDVDVLSDYTSKTGRRYVVFAGAPSVLAQMTIGEDARWLALIAQHREGAERLHVRLTVRPGDVDDVMLVRRELYA